MEDCNNNKLIQNIENILEDYKKSDPLITPLTNDDYRVINDAIAKYKVDCNVCANEGKGDYICLKHARSHLMRRLPWTRKNIYPWRNYDWDYSNVVMKNYHKSKTGIRSNNGSFGEMINNVRAFTKIIDGYIDDANPAENAIAGPNTGNYSIDKSNDNKECVDGDVNICKARNKMRNSAPPGLKDTISARNEDKILKSPFFEDSKMKGIYSSSYYVKMGSCPRKDIMNKQVCKNKTYDWQPNTMGKIISTLSGCNSGCSCQPKSDSIRECIDIKSKGNCIKSCKWNEDDKSNPFCEEADASCDGWNRIDCEGAEKKGGGKCEWDIGNNKCINKLKQIPETNCNIYSVNDCKSPCIWSDEKKFCTTPSIECNDLLRDDCTGTCTWDSNTSSCKDKAISCQYRTKNSCKGKCGWKFTENENDGSCNQPRYMFIDNSPKTLVDGSNGKGLLPALANDMLSLTPDKIISAVKGESVEGHFKQQSCPTIVELSFKTTLQGFTTDLFTIPAQNIYIQELKNVLLNEIKFNNNSNPIGIKLDLIHSISKKTIAFTVYFFVVNSIATKLKKELKKFPGPSNTLSSFDKTKFKESLLSKFRDNKIFLYNELFKDQDISFSDVKCTDNCTVFEDNKRSHFTNYNPHKKYLGLNRTVLYLKSIDIYINILFK